MVFKYPIIQIALDYPTIDEALSMAEIGVRAGVDWIEAGTPLIVAQGVGTIGKLKRAFPSYPVLADYKTMDSGGKNNVITKQQGGDVMTVCGNAPDENGRPHQCPEGQDRDDATYTLHSSNGQSG